MESRPRVRSPARRVSKRPRREQKPTPGSEALHAWIDGDAVSEWAGAQTPSFEQRVEDGGVHRVESLMPDEVAESVLKVMEALPEKAWDLSQHHGSAVAPYSFWTVDVSDVPELQGLRSVFWRLLPKLGGEPTVPIFSCCRYRQSDFIDGHDDRAHVPVFGPDNIYSRAVAGIFYLTKDWKEENGGCFLDLEAQPGSANGGKIVPSFNSFVLFKVPRMHAVSPVATDRLRYTILGWWHLPGKRYELPALKGGADMCENDQHENEAQFWKVVGGADSGGILVRKGMALTSSKSGERLAIGSLLREEELCNGRLMYTLVQGSGPESGWVSIRSGGQFLLAQADGGIEEGAVDGDILRLPIAKIPSSLSSKVQLHDATGMPAMGFGVYRCKPGKETYEAVRCALELGYRLIDTAAIYENEQSVGQAIRDSGLDRDSIWVTTKLDESLHGYQQATNALSASLGKLGLGHIDLLLVHSPTGGKLIETWDAMCHMQKRGLVRSIGVANYNKKHIESLKTHGRQLPTVNQIEMHPLIYQGRRALLQFCAREAIQVQAYGSLFSGRTDQLSALAVTAAVAAHPSKTPAQILLRWALQMGFQVIPKSLHKARMEENAGVFDFHLSDPEMDKLCAMTGNLCEYRNPLGTRVDLGRLDLGEQH